MKVTRTLWVLGAWRVGILACGIALVVLRAQEPVQETHGIAVANLDPSVKPGDDFYLYANGDWIQRTEIPADRARIGVFSKLDEMSSKRTAALIEEAAKGKAAAGTGARKIADLYNSYMDEAGIDAKGLAPLKPLLEGIAAIRDKRELAYALGQTLRADVDALNNTNFHTANLFGLWVAPGFNDSDHYMAYLMQGGVELPDREYYLAQNDRMKQVRVGYQAHVAAMFKLAGMSDGEARAKRVVELEHAIAERTLSLAGIFSRGRTDEAGELRRVAAGRVLWGIGPGRFGAARDLEGLAGISRNRSGSGVFAEGVGGGTVRVFWEDDDRRARAAAEVAAGRGGGEWVPWR